MKLQFWFFLLVVGVLSACDQRDIRAEQEEMIQSYIQKKGWTAIAAEMACIM